MAKSFKLFCLMLILLGINCTFGKHTTTTTTYTSTSTYTSTPTSATNSTSEYSSDSEFGKSKNIIDVFIWFIVGLIMLAVLVYWGAGSLGLSLYCCMLESMASCCCMCCQCCTSVTGDIAEDVAKGVLEKTTEPRATEPRAEYQV